MVDCLTWQMLRCTEDLDDQLLFFVTAWPELNRDELENRLSQFRETLIQSNLQAYIIPTDDAHMSEVPPDCFARRRFLTGFSGSAGTALVTPTEAMLWTDGRYFIQAKMELSSSWKLIKSGIEGTPDLGDWLSQNLRQGDLVGIDPSVHAALPTLELQSKLRKAGIDLRCIEPNLVDQIWKSGRSWPSSPVRLHPQAVAGASASEKLKGVRQKMAEQGADVVLVTALDEVALLGLQAGRHFHFRFGYLFNIRGGDVRHTPVVLAFALVDVEGASIFVDDGKVTREVRKYLEDLQVEVNPYASFGQAVSERVQSGQRVWMDTKRSNYSLFLASGQEGPAVTKRSPVAEMQACKNQAEIKGMVEAHRRDGAALCRAFAQLEAMLKRGEVVTEIDVDRVVTASRAAALGYLERSFDTIAGYGPNAAIIHYVAQAESAATVGTDSMLLLDSGAQYHDGTTDVTRTLKFGMPTSRERELFTRVLKAHIGLATATFPADVPCFVLDAYARRPLWEVAVDYRHGTGHGVGAALAVHEIPPYIGQRFENRDPLKAGMIVSNEPGLYLEGCLGIRIENLMLVVQKAVGKDGRSYLGMCPITLVPIQRNLVDASLLSNAELSYLNAYHARVADELFPILSELGDTEALQFLHRETAEIQRPDDVCWDDIHAKEAAGASPAHDQGLQPNPGDEKLRAYEVAGFRPFTLSSTCGTMWSCGALLPGSIQSRSREGMQQAMPVATISLNTRSVGTAIVIHAGNMITATTPQILKLETEKGDLPEEAEEVFVEVVVGSLLALWGGIGDFKLANSSKRSQEATMGANSLRCDDASILCWTFALVAHLRPCALACAALPVAQALPTRSAAFDGKFWDLLTTWDVTDIPDLSGKVAIVTGPTVNGIGFESTVEMSRKGAQVILAGRSEGKGQEALKELLRRVPDAKADFMKLDLSSLKQVKEFAMNFKAKRLPLHILMNNAGIMANPFSLTVDKLESQFATNHLGHFLLTKLLLPELEASAPARVVTVTSAAAHFPEMMAKLEMPRGQIS
ncbi:putative Xaa-Pro aminopeptidase P [Symbiodinium microadriaticum]|uniref:Putative Xaa-Pro aminopeptidase P n=1 Tax=Symbiodinium microadriaticum TaxID=2951 RepID=A0A1Q9DPL1_SYMMI|nr:putative Xaa-Pro aminopeptidase P [Symbiodinium microadriaticum]